MNLEASEHGLLQKRPATLQFIFKNFEYFFKTVVFKSMPWADDPDVWAIFACSIEAMSEFMWALFSRRARWMFGSGLIVDNFS